MLKNYKKFDTRKWALKNTGYLNSNRKFNELLKKIALKNDEPWIRDLVFKVNRPNATYRHEKDKKLESEKERLMKFLIKDET